MEIFTIGDLLNIAEPYRPLTTTGYFYILNPDGKSMYYNIDWQNTGWYRIKDKLTHPRFNDLLTDIFREEQK